MKTLALATFYRHELKVKRAQNVGGVIGDPSVVLSGIRSTYPIPVDPSGLTGLRESEVVQTLTEVFHIFVEGQPDVREGDTVEVDGTDYVVRVAQEQKTPLVLAAMTYTRLTVEHLTL